MFIEIIGMPAAYIAGDINDAVACAVSSLLLAYECESQLEQEATIYDDEGNQVAHIDVRDAVAHDESV